MIPLLVALSCLPVDGSKLLAKHFAEALPEFSAIAQDSILGFAPVPGAVRTFRADELSRMGSKFGLKLQAPDTICFAWEMTRLDPARAGAAMRAALPINAALEIHELSRGSVPPGDIEFPLSMLHSGLWRGYVRYGNTGRYDVWARVRVTMPQQQVVAVTPLRPGQRIEAEQIRLVEVVGPPESQYVDRIDEAVGLVAKRTFREGDALVTRMLDHPDAVKKGDVVKLRAAVGATQISMDVSAQRAGKIGDVIPVRNPSSGHLLRARVEKAGEVVLAQ